MSELKPCPFCGGKAYIKRTPNYGSEKPRLFVTCCVCGVETPRIARSRKDAVTAWNRRAQPANEPLTLEQSTNADRIRGMSDEEMAVWLVGATVCERVCDEDEYCHGNECVKRVTDWLRQSAEDAHHAE